MNKRNIFSIILFNLPGDNKNMENIIKLKTAAITSNAIKIPRQLRLSGEMATSSCSNTMKQRKETKTNINKNNNSCLFIKLFIVLYAILINLFNCFNYF